MPTVHEIRHTLGHAGIERREHAVNAGRRIEHDALGPRLVVRRSYDRVLEQMRHRPVTDVMEHRRRERVASAIRRELLPIRKIAMDRAKSRDEQLHHERRANGVREPRVLCAGKRQRCHAELTDAAETLNLGRVDEELDDALFVRLERDEAVHGIAKDHPRASRVARRLSATASVAVAIEPSSP